MAELSSVPQTVNLKVYGGDTFTFSITAPDALVAGKEWVSQIRAARDTATVDAVFDITPPAVADGPAFLTLPASVTAALVGVAAQYKGVYDVQVTGPGGATTLTQGTLTVTLDVTRAEP